MGALELVSWWPVDAAAGGVLRRSAPAGAKDASVKDAGAKEAGAKGGGAKEVKATVEERVGDGDRSFAWASITKLLVAMAVLVAVEEGTISLDDPAGPERSTVRHLLAHASGLGPDSPVPVAAPGRMRIYSNVGYEILADTLAQHTQMAFTDYLTIGVLGPLQMSGTALAPGSSPASGAHGPLKDLLTLAAELLAPTIVSTSTLALATSVAFAGLRGVLPGYGRFDPCDWGLGVEVKGDKAPHWTGTRTTPATFGHFGRAGGFLWVDPVAGLACTTLSNRDFGPWAVTEWSTLADAVVEEWTAKTAPTAAPIEEDAAPRRTPGGAETGPPTSAPVDRKSAETARRTPEQAPAKKSTTGHGHGHGDGHSDGQSDGHSGGETAKGRAAPTKGPNRPPPSPTKRPGGQ